ncbi:intracellular iron chaperone frataxin [Marmoricola endophyticus]|uniref:Intracellular iron chaperone frataxin n=1 Tax=Marmoricola endophyticus TaxID=2040280 RepID=A0A917BBS4_9ACTN|nr:DUF1801 domain-containing protein [Marmoricola endophyticus]GGF34568.1 intracellular iron chaperone frataxin [Marmoricola endophyticus]
MDTHEEYLATVEDDAHREKLSGILAWVNQTWPNLVPVVKWNQPMFTDHGTFIIGFSVFPKNIAVNPEPPAMDHFRDAMHAAGYTTSSRLMRITWADSVDHDLLGELIEWQIAGKTDVTGFWRP